MTDQGRPTPRLDDDQRRVEDQIESLQHQLTLSRELLRQATARNATLSDDLNKARRQLRGVRGQPLVRLSLLLSRQFNRLRRRIASASRRPQRTVRRLRQRLRQWSTRRRMRASTSDEVRLVKALRNKLEPASVTTGPLVSVVILNRDGYAHLERCLRALARTSYRELEVIVVDNGSSDGSADLVDRLELPFPARLIRNRENVAFGEANMQGIGRSAGELICLLNNDVEPITEDWLGYMVETITKGADAVGARLIYPSHRGTRRAGAHIPDLRLQHGGVEYDRAHGIPTPRIVGVGEDPLAPEFAAVRDRPAVTAACLLLKRSAIDAVGGFTRGYDYGMEDVDLCLKLVAAGKRIVYDGRAALWHHESATRKSDLKRYSSRVARNRETLVSTWGPRLYRETMLDALRGGRRLSGDPFHVAITVMSHDPGRGFGDWFTAHELGDALANLGWRVTYLQKQDDEWYRADLDADAMIVLLDSCDIGRVPRRIVTMAWVRAGPERWLDQPWFDDFDIVFASSERIAAIVRERSSKVAKVMPLATNPERFKPHAPDADRSCDVLFVGNYWGQHRGVIDALPTLADSGVRVHVYGRGWEQLPSFGALHRGYLAYDDIPTAYASASVVVDDAAMPTLAYGSVNSRVFDGLATGAIVVTNGRLGADALFGRGFPTWTDATSLETLVRDILASPGPATERAAEYREEVLQRHTYRDRAIQVRGELEAWAASTRYGIRIGVPTPDVREQWGDYHFGRAIQRALAHAGRPSRLHILPEWPDPVAAREDVTIHLFGRSEAPIRPAQANLLWHISHPDLATPELYERYDQVYVASDSFAARMDAVTSVKVSPLHQATDPERFRPDPTGPHHQLLLVANSRRRRRPIVDDLAGTTHDFAVYGSHWTPNLIDPGRVRGEYVPNHELRRYYSSADIVLNDHWTDMRDEAFFSNRLYDALACGAFVISDDVPGIDREFDGCVVTYRTPEHLRELVTRYLADPAERRRLGDRGRRVVLERHTFAQRVDRILKDVEPILADRPSRILDGAVLHRSEGDGPRGPKATSPRKRSAERPGTAALRRASGR